MRILCFGQRASLGGMMLEWEEWRWRWDFAHIGLLPRFCCCFSFTIYSLELFIISGVSDIFLIISLELLAFFILSLILFSIFLAVCSAVINIVLILFLAYFGGVIAEWFTLPLFALVNNKIFEKHETIGCLDWMSASNTEFINSSLVTY